MSFYEDTIEEDDLYTGPEPPSPDNYARIDLPRLEFPGDHKWQVHAACLGSTVHFDGAQKAAARAICQECTVREECLTFAVKNGEKYGVWGGLDDIERRGLVR
jgi:WhiB family redox-sensing transcriptional regulator